MGTTQGRRSGGFTTTCSSCTLRDARISWVRLVCHDREGPRELVAVCALYRCSSPHAHAGRVRAVTRPVLR